MKRIHRKCGLLFVLIFVLMGVSGCGQSKPPDAKTVVEFTESPEWIERVAQSVVKLEIYDESDRRVAVGSGFYAIDEKYLITSAHVVENMCYAIVTEDSRGTYRVEKVVGYDDIADVAVLDISEFSGKQILPTAVELPLRGEAIATIGTTAGLVNLVTLGNVSKIWEIGGMNRILFTAAVSAGNSGGPLINGRGEVIGVVMGTYDYADQVNVAISIQEVQNLLHTKK